MNHGEGLCLVKRLAFNVILTSKALRPTTPRSASVSDTLLSLCLLFVHKLLLECCGPGDGLAPVGRRRRCSLGLLQEVDKLCGEGLGVLVSGEMSQKEGNFSGDLRERSRRERVGRIPYLGGWQTCPHEGALQGELGCPWSLVSC